MKRRGTCTYPIVIKRHRGDHIASYRRLLPDEVKRRCGHRGQQSGVLIELDFNHTAVAIRGIDNQGNVRASDPTSSAVIASFCSGPDCVATIANLEVDEAAGTLKIRQDPESLFPGVDGNFAVSLWY